MISQKILGRLKLDSLRAGRPPAAIEIAPQGVLAASRLSPDEPLKYAFQALPPGAVAPGVNERNVHSPGQVTDAIRSTLEQVCTESRAVTIVIPDLTTRVFLLDFDSLPEMAVEAVAIIRFRLRKLVPFNVETAKVSYQALPSQAAGWRVLAAIIPEPVLPEYEEAVRAAGYLPGAVLPSSLAGLRASRASETMLYACLSESSLTTAITRGDDVLLYRAHELPDDSALRLSDLRRDVAVAAAYFEDRVKTSPECLQYAGTSSAADFARSLDLPGLSVIELAPRSDNTTSIPIGSTSIAGVTGALAVAR